MQAEDFAGVGQIAVYLASTAERAPERRLKEVEWASELPRIIEDLEGYDVGYIN